MNPTSKNEDYNEREILNQDDKVQIFLSTLHPVRDLEAKMVKITEEPFYKKLGLTEEPDKLDKHIIYESNEEARAALFIQAIFRVSLLHQAL